MVWLLVIPFFVLSTFNRDICKKIIDSLASEGSQFGHLILFWVRYRVVKLWTLCPLFYYKICKGFYLIS